MLKFFTTNKEKKRRELFGYYRDYFMHFGAWGTAHIKGEGWHGRLTMRICYVMGDKLVDTEVDIPVEEIQARIAANTMYSISEAEYLEVTNKIIETKQNQPPS